MAAVTTILKSAKGRYVRVTSLRRIKSTITSDGNRIVTFPDDRVQTISGTLAGVNDGVLTLLGPKGGKKQIQVSRVTGIEIDLED